MSDNRARSIPCPFCKDGEFLYHKAASTFYWHPRGKGHFRVYLDAMKCSGCGIIVFKERSEDE